MNSAAAVLTWPLSLRAQLQVHQEGAVQELCYGLFQGADETYAQALQRLIGQLVDLLPPPAGCLLLVGAGLGSVLAALSTHGYQVTGVTPDPAQHRLAAQRCGPETLLPPGSSWGALDLADGGYPLILFHESVRRTDLLVLFGKAYRALAEEGSLWLLDEFDDVPQGPTPDDGRPRLPYLLALAERCGFALTDQQDWSQGAALTLDYYHRAMTAYRETLGQELAAPPAALAAAEEANRAARQAYSEGHRRYLLLCFRRRQVRRWRVAAVEERDVPAVTDLFRQVFGQEFSQTLWRWKYGDGRGEAVAAWETTGRLVAHYGGIARRIQYFGRPALACQIGDVMVAPDTRGVLTRRGPFFLAAASYPEAYVGYGARYLVGFGFPNQRAMQVAERLGLYGAAGSMAELYWAPDPSRPALLIRQRRLTAADVDQHTAVIDALWRAMSADLAAALVGVRDSEWWRHRYFAHPHHEYQVLLITHRFTRRACGVMALRVRDRRCELLDLVAPLSQIPRLVGEARRLAAQWQAEDLYCWISTAFAAVFENCGGRRRPLDVMTPTSVWVAGPKPDELRDRWWLMLGDTDFH